MQEENHISDDSNVNQVSYFEFERSPIMTFLNLILALLFLSLVINIILYFTGDSFAGELMAKINASEVLRMIVIVSLIAGALIIVCIPLFALLKQNRFFSYVYRLLGQISDEEAPDFSSFVDYFKGRIKTFNVNFDNRYYKAGVLKTRQKMGRGYPRDNFFRRVQIPEYDVCCYLMLKTKLLKDIPDMVCKRKLWKLTEWKGDLDLETDNDDFYRKYRVFTKTSTAEQMQGAMNADLVEYILRPEVAGTLQSISIDSGNVVIAYRLPLLNYKDFFKDILLLKFIKVSPSNYKRINKHFSDIFEINKNILSLLDK